MGGTKVTAEDVDTGESESVKITDNYVLICDGTAHQASIQVYPKTGTHVITIKGVA